MSGGDGSHGGRRPKGGHKPWQTALRRALGREAPAKPPAQAPPGAPAPPAPPPPPPKEPQTGEAEVPELKARALPKGYSARLARRKGLWLALGALALAAALAVWFRARPSGRGPGTGWAGGDLNDVAPVPPADGRGTPARGFEPIRVVPNGITGVLTPEESKKLDEGYTGPEIDPEKLPRPDEPVILLDPSGKRAPVLGSSPAPDPAVER